MSGEIPRFGLYHDEPILPPSKHKESLTVEQFQEKYPFRYRIYGQTESETEVDNGISPEVIVRRLQMLNNLDRYITAHGGYGKGRVLREKQLAVFRDTYEFLEIGETEGFIEAPTGFGKTVLFSEVIKATNQRTLVVVPSKILVDQTYKKLSESNPTLDIGRYYSDKKERDKQVTVTTYHSLVISCGGVRPEDIDLLILDEVHQSLTDARIEAVERFANPVKLGFTATPEYTRDKRVENLLNNQIHMVTLKEAVETGLLCSFSVYLAETDVDLSSVKVDAGGDYNERELEEAINIYSRNKSAVELYKKLNEERKGLSKAVTYCVSIKHAREVARMFNEAGIQAEAIWSDQNPDERRRILEAYKRGEIKVLTNVNVLTEGFDDPQAGLCLNLRPTLSKVVAKQRGGRVLRLDPDYPKKHAIVVDYLDRNEDKRTLQVTFAQVAEGAKMINPIVIDTNGKDKDRDSEGNGENGDRVLIDKEEPFDLEGLHVITNSQEVLRIVRELEILQDESSLEKIKNTDLLLSRAGLYSIFVINSKKLTYLAYKVKSELEIKHPEYFTRRLNGSHTVDVVAEEGRDAFIKAMEVEGVKLRDKEIQEIKDTDLSLSPSHLKEIFIGHSLKIGSLVKKVHAYLETSYPEYFTKRRSGVHIVDVVVEEGRQLFIKAMIKAGIKLKEESVQNLNDSDLALSQPSLVKVFIGEAGKLSLIAKQVQARLKIEHPEYFAKRKKGPTMVEVVTNEGKQVFINAMLEVGIRLKNLEIQTLRDTDITLSQPSLGLIFKGDLNKLTVLAKKIQPQLKGEHPEYFTKRRSGAHTVDVVTLEGRQAFIEAMGAQGVSLKDNNLQKVQNTDLPLTNEILREVFIGDIGRIFPLVQQIRLKLESQDPNYFAKRDSGAHTVVVVTKEGRQIFVEEMKAAGAIIRDQSIQDLEEGDFILSGLNLMDTFVGGNQKLVPIAQRVKLQLEVDHPEYFIKRRQKKKFEVIVDVVTSEGKAAFIEAMVEAGAKLREVFNL